jgi:hypothetical protein
MWVMWVIVVLFILCIVALSFMINFNFVPECVHDYIVDTNFNVPIEHRTPKLKFRDFITQQESLRQTQMIKTREMFPKQEYEGNIMMGGYHSLLPSNAKWVNHIIEFN